MSCIYWEVGVNAFRTMKTLYMVLGLIYFNPARGQSFVQDTTVNQLNILDATSVRHKLKSDTSKIDLSFASHDSTMPIVKIKNQTGDQVLTMIFHPGDSKYQFAEFKVSPADNIATDHLTINLNDKEFRTGNGIKLGIKKSELLNNLGKPTVTKKAKGLETIEYEITKQDAGILKKYHQAEYFATYIFKGDKLIEFHFGFVYP